MEFAGLLSSMSSAANTGRGGAGRVSSLCWSADSDLLAVTVEQDDRRLLQLWQRRNWHWYLKKERRFELKQVCRRPN